MDRQPVLTDADTVHEAAGDHPPADGALQAAEREQAEQARHQPALDPAGGPEQDERYKEDDADQAPEQAVAPFPPEDLLELVDRHALVDDLVLRNLLVFGEFFLPLDVADRRNHTMDRLPLGDRETRAGQARGAADDDHGDDHHDDGAEPDADQRAVALPVPHRGLLHRAVRRQTIHRHRAPQEISTVGLSGSARRGQQTPPPAYQSAARHPVAQCQALPRSITAFAVRRRTRYALGQALPSSRSCTKGQTCPSGSANSSA